MSPDSILRLFMASIFGGACTTIVLIGKTLIHPIEILTSIAEIAGSFGAFGITIVLYGLASTEKSSVKSGRVVRVVYASAALVQLSMLTLCMALTAIAFSCITAIAIGSAVALAILVCGMTVFIVIDLLD
jgi:hypothetical protein